MSSVAMSVLQQLESRTKTIYDDNAAAFDRERLKNLYEKKWLDIFLASLPNGADILDVGCGTGEPITAYFIRNGYKVTGIDFSRKMIEIAANRFPTNEWIIQDMRKLSIGRQYDGIISWNAFFHLNHHDQRLTLQKFNEHLKPGGYLLLTVGPEEGEVTGLVNGNLVYHSSLSFAEYNDIAMENQSQVVKFIRQDPECNQHSVLLIRKGSFDIP